MPIYKYATLDDPLATSATGTNAVGINNAGQVVGEYSDASGIHGFLFSGGTYTTLNDPLAPNFTEVFGINGAGQIVGDYVVSGGGGGLLLSGGTYTTLNPPGSVSTIAEDINSKGQAVGWYFTSGSNYLTHGFIRLSDGSYLTYDDPYAGTSTLHRGTRIRGVNDALAIVGEYYDGSNHRHGFFIQGLFHLTLDDPFAGHDGTQAGGINNQGQIPLQQRDLHHARPSARRQRHLRHRHQ
jgi:probable HAF family extracellular repeat protein